MITNYIIASICTRVLSISRFWISPLPISANKLKMNMMPDKKQRAKELRQIGQLLSQSIETLASEWESEEISNGAENGARPAGVPHVQYDASRTIQACIGSLTSLVTPPHNRLTSLAMSYTIARVLHLAVEHNIPELLAQAGCDGTSAATLAALTGLDPGKLCVCLLMYSCRMIRIY